MNDIIKALNLEDDTIRLVEIITNQNSLTKTVVIEKPLVPHVCPICGFSMYSKGITHRKAKHQMLLDGYKLYVEMLSRRWVCQNQDCKHSEQDEYLFIEPRKRITNLIPFLIINELKDINKTCSMVAAHFNVSDTYVHDTFTKFVDMKRLPLPRILSIDEVHLDINEKTKLCCVLMDFETREIVDILPNRWKTTLDAYFYSISFQERGNVEYIVSDMYSEYLTFPDKYFRNAKIVIDSFHVVSYLNQLLNNYLVSVKKKYQKRDKERLKKKNELNNLAYSSIKQSKELILLNHYKFFLLADYEDIQWNDNPTKRNKYFHIYLSTHQLEKMFYEVDDKFEIYKNWKQTYIDFNKTKFDTVEEASSKLDEITNEYFNTNDPIFTQFALLLTKHHNLIINSFKWVQINKSDLDEKNKIITRLSNGPMEGFNRKPKDTKRNARGYSNFDFIRNRLIFSNRKNPSILGTPKSTKQIHSYKGKKRRSYNKNR